MKKAERKLNNQGFSLILVIVCMTLIGVLATMILSTAVNNVQMRVVEEEASDNFYSAEEVLDEIKANVEKKANEALGSAYSLFLQKYASTAPKNRESVFVESLTDVLDELFKKDFVTDYDEDAFAAEYLGVTNGTEVSIGQAGNVIVDKGSAESTITIQGLSVTFTDGDGYKTGIKTDLVVKITYPKFFEDNAAGPAFLDYSVIADGNIEKDSGTFGSTLGGCVYTGNDLVVSGGSKLSVQAPYLIAKNQINVGNSSDLTVAPGSGLVYASTKYLGLWTKNIVTTTTDLTDISANKITISDINSYVQDDLTINGIEDVVTINKGSYYGYGSGLTGVAETNSAININARDIVLSITNLNHLWLAGQSYISVPLGYGRNVSEEDAKNVQASVMQGESVSFKGNQAAYLLPGDCIEGVWHNPMTKKEYEDAVAANGGIGLVLSTRKAESINGDIMNLDQYLDISSNASAGDYTSRYKEVYVQYAVGGAMVYIYMNFSTPNAAKNYFDEYYSINKDLVDTRMETIGRGTITVDNISNITATGNLVVHSNSGSEPNTIINSNTAATNSQVREADYGYSGNFRNLTMSLDARTTYYGSGDNLTDCIFRFEDERMTALAPLHNTHKVTYDGQEYTLYVADNDGAEAFPVDTGKNRGLVLATGDVHVSSSFTGLIIAQGVVTVADGVSVTSAPQAINALITYEEEGKDFSALRGFFKYYDDANAGEESKEAVDIYFDNWQKN